MNKILKATEFTLHATRRLQAIDKRLFCCISTSKYSKDINIILRVAFTDTSKWYYGGSNIPTMDDILDEGRKLLLPKYVKIKIACIDLIDEKVYIGTNKVEGIVVSINREGIGVEVDGLVETHDTTNLFIKE